LLAVIPDRLIGKRDTAILLLGFAVLSGARSWLP
jgi:hypothetical protein